MAISSPQADLPRAERTIAVIGSARLSPPDPRCLPAEQIGAATAARGWTLIAGGYGDAREATAHIASKEPRLPRVAGPREPRG